MVYTIIVNRLYVHDYTHYFSPSIAFRYDCTWRGQPLLHGTAVDLFYFSLNLYTDAVMSNPTSATYRIGTNFCLELGRTSPTPRTNINLNLRILNLESNWEKGIAAVFPAPDIMVEKDGVTYYSAPSGTNPSDMVTIEFMMEYPLLRPGAARLEDPQALQTAVFGDRLTFRSDFALRNGSTPISVRCMIFESLLGTWTTTVNNSLGGETCSSTIRECGECLCDCVKVCLCEVCLCEGVFVWQKIWQ